jgi:hypothetical protein
MKLHITVRQIILLTTLNWTVLLNRRNIALTNECKDIKTLENSTSESVNSSNSFRDNKILSSVGIQYYNYRPISHSLFSLIPLTQLRTVNTSQVPHDLTDSFKEQDSLEKSENINNKSRTPQPNIY